MSKGHENQGNDHQREIALIFNKFSRRQPLLENVWRPVRRIQMFTMGLKGLIRLVQENNTEILLLSTSLR